MTDLIIREWNDKSIRQREDGFMSLTDMCQAGGKLFADFYRLKTTKEYLDILTTKYYQNSDNGPVESKVGGSTDTTGSWGDRRVAIRLAQWISPAFALQVDEWVMEHLENVNSHHAFKSSFFDSLIGANHCDQSGFVYALHDKGNSKVKIGYTTDPIRRLKQLQHGDSGGAMFHAVRMTPTIEEAQMSEKHLHNLFKLERLSGEWFRDDLIDDSRFTEFFFVR